MYDASTQDRRCQAAAARPRSSLPLVVVVDPPTHPPTDPPTRRRVTAIHRAPFLSYRRDSSSAIRGQLASSVFSAFPTRYGRSLLTCTHPVPRFCRPTGPRIIHSAGDAKLSGCKHACRPRRLTLQCIPPSVRSSVRLSVHLYLHPFVRTPSAHPYVHQESVRPYVHPSVHFPRPSVRLYVYSVRPYVLSVYLSVRSPITIPFITVDCEFVCSHSVHPSSISRRLTANDCLFIMAGLRSINRSNSVLPLQGFILLLFIFV